MNEFSPPNSKTVKKNPARVESECGAALPQHALQDLLEGGKRAVIIHRDRRYLLTLTRRDRLILTLDETSPEQPG